MSAATSIVTAFPSVVWRHPLLASLDARARIELESAGSSRVLADGEKLFVAGDPADALFVVVRGEIAIRAAGRRAELRRASVGDAVGEEAVARAHATRRDDATSVGECELVSLPAALLRRVMTRGESTDAGLRTKRWLLRSLAQGTLERSAFARDLPGRARDAMLDAGRTIDLRRGEILYREGDGADAAYFIAEGVVQLSSSEGERRVLAYHTAGDFFGDEVLAQVDGPARDATATATSDVSVFAVRGEIVHELARAHEDALARALRVQTAARAEQARIRENATRHVLADLHRFETSRSLLAIDQERCLRCGHCAWSCAEAHDDGVSRLLRRGDVVVAKLRGETRTLLLPSSCQHCKNPACMIDCPTGAITRDARGEVRIREELCTGCGSCAKACPWENIQMAPRDVRRLPVVQAGPSVAIKCDLCAERGEAACVAACPADAIVRIDPSVELDEVRAVLDRTARPTITATRRSIVVPAIVAASALCAIGAYAAFDAIGKRASGVTLLVAFVALAGYAIVKRARVRARGKARALLATRPHFVAHLALGLGSFGVAAAHAGSPRPSALALAFWGAGALGALAGTFGALVPRRLARLERVARLPEELPGAIREIDARVFRELSGTSDLLKGLYERMLRPFSRSTLTLVAICVVGTAPRALRERLLAHVHALVAPDDERLVGLERLVGTVVERQSLRAQRVLGAILRASSFAHVVVVAALAVLVALHVVAQVRS